MVTSASPYGGVVLVGADDDSDINLFRVRRMKTKTRLIPAPTAAPLHKLHRIPDSPM